MNHQMTRAPVGDVDELEHPLIHEMEDVECPFREGDRVRRVKDGHLGFVEHCWSRPVDLATLPHDCRPWMIHTLTVMMDDGEYVSRFIDGNSSNFERAPTSAPRPPWRRVLGARYGRQTTRESVLRDFKFLAKTWHPDHGGSTAAMAMLNTARDEAMAEFDKVMR